MLRTTCFLTFFAFFFEAQAQNLIANGSMEELNLCMEYDKQCAPEAWFRYPPVSIRWPGNLPKPAEGKQFELMVMENFGVPIRKGRVFLYTWLLCPLEAGRKYRFSCYVNPARQKQFQLGAYLSANKPNLETNDPFQQPPSFVVTEASRIKKDEKGWIKVSCDFSATGGEEYLTLGNFDPKRLVITEKIRKNRMLIFYLVDGVELVPIEQKTPPCLDMGQRLESLYAQNHRHVPRKTIKFIEDSDSTEMTIPDDDPFNELDEVEEVVSIKTDTVPVAPEVKFVIPDIGFDFGKYDLKPAVDSMLETCAKQMALSHPIEVHIFGFTDNVGSDAYNLDLSDKRAIAVRDWFVLRHGFDSLIFQVKGLGESNPVDSNETEAGRQANRRVEIKFVK